MNGYNTLDTISETFLTLLSTVAQGESEAKSEALKWSYRQRFKKEIPVNNMWAIMGYDTDENGKIFIVEKEAEIVRFMFAAYLDGKSTTEIAEALTIGGDASDECKALSKLTIGSSVEVIGDGAFRWCNGFTSV